MNHKTVLRAVLLLACTLGASRSFAFVPACTEEVAMNYPPILRADLSACRVPAEPRPEQIADLKLFADHLGGSWELESRTVQGITQPVKSRLVVQLDILNPTDGKGSVSQIDCTDRSCAQSKLAGRWSLSIQADADRIAVTTTTGESVLTAGAKTAAAPGKQVAQSKFFLQTGVYVAIDEAAGSKLDAERKWDRIVLTEKTLTYVSCRDGRVDRYVKTRPSKLGRAPRAPRENELASATHR